MAKKPRILFISKRDIGLGLMAEGFARAQAGSMVDVRTVGTLQDELDPFYTWSMNEAGIDLTILAPIPSDSAELPAADWVVNLGSAGDAGSARGVGGQVQNWNLPTPAATKVQPQDKIKAVRAVRNEIEIRVRKLLSSALGRQPS